MRLLIGMPDPSSWGGVQACEPPFVSALRAMDGLEVAEETYVYGDKLNRTSLFGRVARVMETGGRFRRALRRQAFDLVHLNTAFDMKTVLRDTYVVSLMRGSGARVFLKIHGSDQPFLDSRGAVRTVLGARLLAMVDGVGLLSNEERENFVAAGVPEEKLFVVKNCVREVPDPPRREFGAGATRFLFVARFLPTKGLAETIRAAGIVRDRGYTITVDCLGDGEFRREAETLVTALGLQDVVRFAGYVPESEVDGFYARSDCLVFPTFHHEGFPMVIFNALAMGLPIITTRIRAARDYLSEPENCLWTRAKSPEDTARCMIEFIERRDRRQTISANNVALARSFTAAAVAPEYLQIYRTILGRDPVVAT